MKIDFRTQRGQSMTEYTIVCAALALGLFQPGIFGENAVIWELLNAFQIAYEKYAYSLSLPI